METISEIERFNLAQDADKLSAFNKEVERWQDSVTTQLKAAIGSRSLRIARELEPKAYTDNYGLINRLGFSFPRHGVYIHKGAGRGQGGFIGSKWSYLKRVNGIEINTSIIRHTNPASLGKQDEGNRRAYRWFDPVIKNRLPELADICMRYFDTMLIDATKIYIEK
ncbi:hypothetical protein ABH007_06930 [Bacteroides thetaiotaomicron]|nr:hypothetical protein [Bacteroides thetaiotaomicron]MDC2047521.1 hypothetical protein [Bacteroides thetaiotaomicron]MDC2070188.1 hypothetical protein [Bacteroides thetaiotaomicron]